MWGIATWFSKQDQFGSWAKFNYRGESGYGTGYGGCCSVIVTIISFLFIVMQLYGWIFQPSYNQDQTTTYLSNSSDQANAYEITPGGFLPTFIVSTHHKSSDNALLDDYEYNWSPSDQKYWNVYYQTYDMLADP